MADERTIPLLPCGSIDEVAEFYGVLGFDVTYRQMRPNPYVVVEREGIGLHFFGLPDFRPQDSYGSCLVYVPDTGVLYQAFAEGMRTAYGKLLVSGIPRMTRPRKRRNTGALSGFSVIDPGGNWIRIFSQPRDDDEPGAGAASELARALRTDALLAAVRETALDDAERGHLAEALSNARELEIVRGSDPGTVAAPSGDKGAAAS